MPLKYFETKTCAHRFLRALAVIDPINRQHMDLTEQKDNWKFLGESLSHVISKDNLMVLLVVELPDFQRLQAAEAGVEVDLWWSQVAEVTMGGERQFTHISRLALALCTVASSSSEVERNFSDMEAVYSDSRANRTEEALLEAKMTVKSAVKKEEANCRRCVEAEEDRKRRTEAGEKLGPKHINHCHCKLLEVDAELIADLRNCGPHKRAEESEKKSKVDNLKKKKDLEEAKKKAVPEEAEKLKKAVFQLRKNYCEKQKEKEKEKEKEGVVKKKKKKRVAIEKLAASQRKRQKLGFLIDEEGNTGRSLLMSKEKSGEARRRKRRSAEGAGSSKENRSVTCSCTCTCTCTCTCSCSCTCS